MNIQFETGQGKFTLIKIAETWNKKDRLAVSMGIEQELLSVNQFYHPIQIVELGFVNELTEEQWSVVVGKVNWSDKAKYLCYDDSDTVLFKSAIKSGKSLMESLGVDITDNYFLVKHL
jgi:hypothetical protein